MLLAKINLRLQQAKNNKLRFGGISIILAGDPAQLLPVCASPLYDTALKSNMSILGKDLYFQFKYVVKLTQLVRQQYC